MTNKKSTANQIIHGTLLLTAAGFISRILGFFYRIFLSNTIGAEGMGIYQLIFPIYGLCNAVCTASIQTAISRYVASEGSHSEEKAKNTMHAGLFLSVSLSALLALVVYTFAQPIACFVLKEERCTALLRIMAISLPVGAIHTSINGYYYGLQKTSVPALSQLAEQIIRVFSVYMMAAVSIENGFLVTPALAVYGLLLGEAASVLYCLIALSFHNRKNASPRRGITAFRTQMKRIFLLALPLSINRFMLSLLQSIEAVFIPASLKKFGLDTTEALTIYGVFSGMAMPFILFPSALTNSIAVMLLPAIARAQSFGDKRQVKSASSLGIKYSLLIGILCTGIFLLYGKDMGLLVFKNEAAGNYIQILAWLCPFLYLTTTAGSILNGLEKTGITFLHNMAALAIRIFFVLFFIPRYGILGYLWGLLTSQLAISAMHLFTTKRLVDFTFSPTEFLIVPIVCFAVSVFGCNLFFQIFEFLSLPDLVMLAIRMGIICILYFSLIFSRERRS